MEKGIEQGTERGKLIGLHFGLAILYAVLAFVYYRHITDPSAAILVPVGGDFMNIWLAGKLVLAGQADIIYDTQAYYEAQQAAFAANIEKHTFPYPPFFLPFTAPFGLLPYGVAYFVWSAGTFGLFMWALRSFKKQGWDIVLLLAFAPACYVNLIAGQNGFLSAALFIGALGLLKHRPVLAGVLFGLLTYKPHLGILIPFALMVRGEWKAFVAAAAVAIGLIASGLLFFGMDMIVDYINAASYQREVMEEWSGMLQMMMPSAFMAVRLLDGPLWLGYGVHFVLALVSLFAVIWAWRRSENSELRAAVLICAALLAVPYVFNYDMVAAAAAVVILYPYVRGRTEHFILAAIWILPLFVIFLNMFGVPLGPFVLMAALYLSLRCIQREHNHSAA